MEVHKADPVPALMGPPSLRGPRYHILRGGGSGTNILDLNFLEVQPIAQRKMEALGCS